jgi:hypothetical protein
MKPSLHQRLRDAASSLSGEPVALSQLVALHGTAAQGSVLVLLAMWRGQGSSALPQRVAKLQLSARWARQVLRLLARFYGLAGRCSHQRLSHLAVARPRSWMAGHVGLMGGLIFLPIPLGNVLPALALVLLGLGLAFRDGWAVLLATAAASMALAYTLALGMAAWTWGLAPLLKALPV